MAVDLELPPGFRFHPTDEELVMHYLCRKCASQPISVPIIAEIDLYKHNPWDLPGLGLYGEKEWYFFSHRDRKYPNGSRPNRAAGGGYWKATGADKPIGGPKPVGIKKALVFYDGKAPKGVKTNWIMHEYRLADVDRSARKKNSLRLDDWVLCRIYNKKGKIQNQPPLHVSTNDPESNKLIKFTGNMDRENKAEVLSDGANSGQLPSSPSCSEQAVSSELTSEVHSQPRLNEQLYGFPYTYMDDVLLENAFYSQFPTFNQMSPLQDMFTYIHKPF